MEGGQKDVGDFDDRPRTDHIADGHPHDTAPLQVFEKALPE
jgi:hypothetical protein